MVFIASARNFTRCYYVWRYMNSGGTMKKWLLRSLIGLIAGLVAITVIGSIYEFIGRRKAAKTFPPPGKMVDIGGRSIQLDCRGTGSPTVVFESGLDIHGSLSWAAVQDAVAENTRACTYSRAGIMWSDPGPAPRNGKSIAEDLHTALERGGERGPFVLVGHSLGGPYAMTFTKYFGNDVAGLVLVDPSHPEQTFRFKTVGQTEPSAMININKLGAALAWSGVVRALQPLFPGLPNQPPQVARSVTAYASTSLEAAVQETDALEQTLAEAGTFRGLGNRPLVVLTSMAPLPAGALAAMEMTPEQGRQFKELWKGMHDEEAAWSSSSWHLLIQDAGHYIQFDRPAMVTAAVRSVVAKVRGK